MWKKPVDVIAEKQEKLEALELKAADALDIVTRTINGLEETNREIDSTISEIKEYIGRLTATQSALYQNKTRNDTIIANFSRLVSIGDDA